MTFEKLKLDKSMLILHCWCEKCEGTGCEECDYKGYFETEIAIEDFINYIKHYLV